MNVFSVPLHTRSLLSIFIAFLLAYTADDEHVIQVGAFSEAQRTSPVGDGWELVTLRKEAPTQYEFVEMQGTKVVKASSNNAISGLRKSVNINPVKHPFLSWRWRVSNVLKKGDLSRKKGDDFAARIFVTFAYDAGDLPLTERLKYRALHFFGYDDIPVRAINYVWANKAPAGTVADNAHTSWVKMIVLRDGESTLNDWHTEKRNLYEDYRTLFGEPPVSITGIAVMTDTDNTGESATAYYGDIMLSSTASISKTQNTKP